MPGRHGSVSAVTRWLLLGMYLVLIAAGVVSLIRPSPLVYSLIPGWVMVLWGSFFVGGATLSAAGVWRGNWAGEAIGLPLLASACALYATALWVQTAEFGPHATGAVVFTGLVIAALAIKLAERWLVALTLLRISRTAVGDGH